MTDDIGILLKRIEKLEKWNLNFKLIIIFLFCALIAMFLLGAIKWEKEIVTENLKIVDKNGNINAEIKGDFLIGPSLCLYDSIGKKRIVMEALSQVPGIFFYDSDGKARMVLGMNGEEPGLCLYDYNQELRMKIDLFKGGPGIFLFDPNGQPSITMSSLLEKESMLSFSGTDGNQIMTLYSKKDKPSFYFNNSEGVPKIIMLLSNGEPNLIFCDSNGKPTYKLP